MSKVHSVIDQLQCKHDVYCNGALVTSKSLFLKDLLLTAENFQSPLKLYRLKDQIPAALTGIVGYINGASCKDYLIAAMEKGLAFSIDAVFPVFNRFIDFDEVEIDGHNYQPKIDVLTARLDTLDDTFALDAEVVAAFVEQLSSGGDAFSLIDSKVLVETQRAIAAEGVVSSGLATEVSDRIEAVASVQSDVLERRLITDSYDQGEVDGKVSTVQTDIDQNEADGDSDRAAIRAEFQAADTALVSDATSAGDTLGLLEDRLEVQENTFSDIYIAEAINSSSDALVDDATATGNTLHKLENRLEVQEATWNNSAVSSQIDSAVATLIDSAPGALQTLNDLAAALGDDEDHIGTMINSLALKRDKADSYKKNEVDAAILVVQQDVNQNEVDADSAILDRRLISDSYDQGQVDGFVAAVQADVDQNEVDADSAIADRRLITDSYNKVEIDGKVSAVQADVDQNEVDADSAIADRRLISDSYNKVEIDGKVSAVQADVDQNEVDADSAIADRRLISDSYNKVEIDGKVSAVQADVDQNEVDADSAIADRRLISDSYNKVEIDAAILVVQQDVDQNEVDADSAIADRRLISDSYDQGEVDGFVAAKQNSLLQGQIDVCNGEIFSTAYKSKVDVNDGKLTYGDAVLVASHTVDIAANAAGLVTKGSL